jgi:hypothetical protein
MEPEARLTGIDGLREVAALRHTLLIDDRLRLEFLSNLSRLFREYEVPISNRVLGTLILALPDELSDGDDEESLETAPSKGRKKAGKKKRTPVKPPLNGKPPKSPRPPKAKAPKR